MDGRTRPQALMAHATDTDVEHLVLATDGRAGASAATRWVAERALAHVLDVDLVHVARGRRGRPIPGRRVTGDAPTKRARTLLGVVAPSVETRVRLSDGDALTVLTALSETADLVVLGTRRRAPVARLGAAFSTRLAEAARCPVVVVPDGWRRSIGPVVVGVTDDGSDTGAIDFAAREASSLRRDLVLVHAWQMAPLVWPALQVDSAGRATAHGPAARLEAVADRVRRQHIGLAVVSVLEQGAPARALVRDARYASLLVVGTRALSVVDRLLEGSTSRGVLGRPACPVAVVPSSAGGR